MLGLVAIDILASLASDELCVSLALARASGEGVKLDCVVSGPLRPEDGFLAGKPSTNPGVG